MYGDSSGKVNIIRGCDGDLGEKFCPDAVKSCSHETKVEHLKSCAGACCETDNCNNFTPTTGKIHF